MAEPTIVDTSAYGTAGRQSLLGVRSEMCILPRRVAELHFIDMFKMCLFLWALKQSAGFVLS